MSHLQKSKQYRKRILILRVEEIILVISAIVLVGVMLYLKQYMVASDTAMGMESKTEYVPAATQLEEAEAAAGQNRFQIDVINGNGDSGSIQTINSDEAMLIIQEEILQKEIHFDTEAEYEWLQSHKGLFPKEKVEAAEGNAGLIHFLYQYGNEGYTLGGEFELTDAELSADIPLLMQWDERWGYEEYGSFNVGISGCGPTCLSMVLIGFTKDEQLNPLNLADYAMSHNYYLSGTGTKWAFFSDVSKLYGITCNELSVTEEAITGELKKGHPVICSMRRGQFTRAGHFIVLTEENNGVITINDPNSLELSQKEWYFADIKSEIAHAWSFEQ